jgi:hypothetical protein
MGAHKEALKLAIKDEFLARFRETNMAESNRGPMLSLQWLYENFLPSLSAQEEAALEEVIAEMLHNGIIVRTDGPQPTYWLTHKGRELLCL